MPDALPFTCETLLQKSRDVEGNRLICGRPAIALMLTWEHEQDYEYWYVTCVCSLHRTYAMRHKACFVRLIPLSAIDYEYDPEEASND